MSEIIIIVDEDDHIIEHKERDQRTETDIFRIS